MLALSPDNLTFDPILLFSLPQILSIFRLTRAFPPGTDPVFRPTNTFFLGERGLGRGEADGESKILGEFGGSVSGVCGSARLRSKVCVLSGPPGGSDGCNLAGFNREDESINGDGVLEICVSCDIGCSEI